jgi:hypothetical protein
VQTCNPIMFVHGYRRCHRVKPMNVDIVAVKLMGSLMLRHPHVKYTPACPEVSLVIYSGCRSVRLSVMRSVEISVQTFIIHISNICSVSSLSLDRAKKPPWPLVRKRTIPTERPPLIGEVSANFC